MMSVRGAQSFEDLQRHVGVTYSTFREACQARELLGNDSGWSQIKQGHFKFLRKFYFAQ
jgi:hypothetical protein